MMQARSRWYSRLAFAIAAVGLAIALLLPFGKSNLEHTASTSPTLSPRLAPSVVLKNIAPIPNFLAMCKSAGIDNSVGCVAAIMQATNRARVLEGIPALSIRIARLRRLTEAQQLFAIVDLARVGRGLAPFTVETASLDRAAMRGASAQKDPTAPADLTGGAQVIQWGSNWAGDAINSLATSYFWLYDDGPDLFNVDCPCAGSPGCWGHRENELGAYPPLVAGSCPPEVVRTLAMGTAVTLIGSTSVPSISLILAEAYGKPPTDVVFTWKKALRLLGK